MVAKLSYTILVAVASLWRASEVEEVKKPPQRIQILTRVPAREFARFSPIDVTIEGENRDDDVYNISPYGDAFDKFRFEVYRDDRLAAKTRYGAFLEERRGYLTPLKAWIAFRPSQVLKYKIYADEIFDMTEPGKYVIRIGLPCTNRRTSVSSIVWASPIVVSVVEAPGRGPGTQSPR